MEQFVRRVNLDGYERHWIPMDSKSSADRRGLVNETAFRLFTDFSARGRTTVESDLGAITSAFESACLYIYGPSCQAVPGLDQMEADEATQIARRLGDFFSPPTYASDVFCFPKFAGSGIVDSCVGDVMVGTSEIWEIKSGDRAMRSVDFRQISVYAALYYGMTGQVVSKIGILNPRVGISFVSDMERFSTEICGQSASDYVYRLVSTFSTNLVSA
jgi:hypothetical protein